MKYFRYFLFLFLLLFSAVVLSAWEQSGVASWYGGIFQGRKTANGEIYDTYSFTCAHKTLPFGTVLKVTNLKNNKSVVVRVNDRGPFVDGRIIDLTYAAAKKLDMIHDGTAYVSIETVNGDIPEIKFNIQIGAWGDLDNAVNHRKTLEKEGLSPVAKLGSDGLTRIYIPGVKEENVYKIVNSLEKIGYNNLFIYQVN